MGTDNIYLLCLKNVVIENTSQPPLYPMNKGLEAVRFAFKPHPKVHKPHLIGNAPAK